MLSNAQLFGVYLIDWEEVFVDEKFVNHIRVSLLLFLLLMILLDE